MEIDVTVVVAIIGSVLGICGWLSSREKTIGNEAKWRGNVDAKLDLILDLQKDIVEIENIVKECENRLTFLESSVKACHRRMDELKK